MKSEVECPWCNNKVHELEQLPWFNDAKETAYAKCETCENPIIVRRIVVAEYQVFKRGGQCLE